MDPTVVPPAEADASVALERAARALGSAVAGRCALFDRLGSAVADALVAVAGRTEEDQRGDADVVFLSMTIDPSYPMPVFEKWVVF